MRDKNKFLFDMLDSCRFVLQQTADRSAEDYAEDRMFRSAIERELQIIAEAPYQLNAIDSDTAAKITEHGRIIAFRHVLVHGYDALEPETVWAIVTEKLPELKVELEGLLEN